MKKSNKNRESEILAGEKETSMDRIKRIEQSQIEDVFSDLETNQKGLSQEEAEIRLEKYGPNDIEEKRKNPFLKFLTYFWGPIPWMIEAAAFLSGIVQDWPDFFIVVLMLAINAGIGFYQEHKADNAIELLKNKLEIKAHVKRNGKWEFISAKKLVPGDLIHIKYGEIVPSDAKILNGVNIELDQSVLTGESLPVYKEIGKVAFMSSTVKKGEADALVVGTGLNTYFGATAHLIVSTKTQSHYQKSIMKIGKFLIFSTLILVGIIFIVALFRSTPFINTMEFSLILTVAAIPVAMPAVLSVTLAVGALKLAQMKAIVSRLVSIEEMASMDVLCCDKTGTLTENRMTLGESNTFDNCTKDELILYGALSSKLEDEDPIESVIFNNLQGGLDVLKDYKVLNWLPFDPVIKRTEATIETKNGSIFKVSKGAPQAIYSLCSQYCKIEDKINSIVEHLGSKGYRTLGVAKTDENDRWEYLGLLSLYDPPREDSASTIEAARKHGIFVKMLTGDHLAIAKEIGRQLSIGSNILKADDIFAKDGKCKDIDLINVDGFAQVYPEHKYDIVKRLRKKGYYVGMTGDGVNDAPALKAADVGIAVDGATDAARASADLVLTSSGLSVIVSGIEESRRIFRRMTSYSVYRIAETIRVLLFMTFSILVFDFYPVTTIMIIILALLNDGPIMMIAYDKTDTPEEPIRWDMRKVLIVASVLGILGVISSFLFFWMFEFVFPLDRIYIQTLMFLKLTVAGHMTIYLTRSMDRNFWQRPLPSGRLFYTSEITQLVATLFAAFGIGMVKISWGLVGIVWAYAFAWFALNNFIKVQIYRKL